MLLYVMEEPYQRQVQEEVYYNGVNKKVRLSNEKTPLHRCPPPKLYIVQITAAQLSSCRIKKNDECVGIDLELSSIPEVVYYGQPTQVDFCDYYALLLFYYCYNDEWAEQDASAQVKENKCPYKDILGACPQAECPYNHDAIVMKGQQYKKFKKRERDVNIGNETKYWKNPKIEDNSIGEYRAARKMCCDYASEFNVNCASSHCNWIDVLPFVWIYQLTFVMDPKWNSEDCKIKIDELYDSLQKNCKSIFDRGNKEMKVVNDFEENFKSHKFKRRFLCFPRVYSHGKYRPLWVYNSIYIDHQNIIRKFLQECNQKFGIHHLVGFCLVGCLVNYPPVELFCSVCCFVSTKNKQTNKQTNKKILDE
ncbi:hypothetical protein RFI_20714 [Reticulomyxa filosa]|uniref:C3H1-type domain-containing protein n=1 Tax=Reticulomyxa filosa TaxID=46433 RepID=X6MT46_RETFI|nr:hypothetical protein RFI_20714 [Reticulomyxa filosa]|eukprot:ETO16627.1 hypothetical protein RFI_20714 [Reticulomyxa filosa]